MSITYAALIGEGDKWLEQAATTYRGGGDYGVATAEASIAAGYYARALLEKPDTFATLLSAQAQAKAAAAASPPVADTGLDAAVARHPAGKGRTAKRAAKRTPPRKGTTTS